MRGGHFRKTLRAACAVAMVDEHQCQRRSASQRRQAGRQAGTQSSQCRSTHGRKGEARPGQASQRASARQGKGSDPTPGKAWDGTGTERTSYRRRGREGSSERASEREPRLSSIE